MGDRGNVRIISTATDVGDIYFYTHWHGSDLQTIVASAIASPEGRNRWHDEAYLNRIIFERMLDNASDREHGFGIAPYEVDSGELITVNHANKTMTFGRIELSFTHVVEIMAEMSAIL